MSNGLHPSFLAWLASAVIYVCSKILFTWPSHYNIVKLVLYRTWIEWYAVFSWNLSQPRGSLIKLQMLLLNSTCLQWEKVPDPCNSVVGRFHYIIWPLINNVTLQQWVPYHDWFICSNCGALHYFGNGMCMRWSIVTTTLHRQCCQCCQIKIHWTCVCWRWMQACQSS
jgi:hypothetical protein